MKWSERAFRRVDLGQVRVSTTPIGNRSQVTRMNSAEPGRERCGLAHDDRACSENDTAVGWQLHGRAAFPLFAGPPSPAAPLERNGEPAQGKGGQRWLLFWCGRLVVTSDTQHRFILGGAGRRSSFCAIFLRCCRDGACGRFALDPTIDILEGMAGNLFDVFVVGSTDPSAAGETRLAAALSAKHGLPLATVAKAISAKNLRAGQSLDQAQAQALVRHLQAIGAVTVIRSA